MLNMLTMLYPVPYHIHNEGEKIFTPNSYLNSLTNFESNLSEKPSSLLLLLLLLSSTPWRTPAR
jgi:hypothetical protein